MNQRSRRRSTQPNPAFASALYFGLVLLVAVGEGEVETVEMIRHPANP